MKRKKLTMFDAVIFYTIIIVGLILIPVSVTTNLYDEKFQTAKPEQIITVYKNPTINIPVVYQIPFTNKFIHKEVKPYGVRINYDTGYLEHYLILENNNVYTTREIAIKDIGGN